jgi:hypothetical protein
MIISGAAAVDREPNPHSDDRIDLITHLHGTNITYREYMETVNPKNLEIMRRSVSQETFDEFCNQIVYWGNDYPSLPYGADIWTESGPLNLSALNRTERERYGIRNAILGGNGYRILDYLDWQITTGEPVSFYRRFPDGMEYITCDLNWIDTESSLKITVFGPDGMMGSYYDLSDGKEDGRIFLQLFRDQGLTGGDWYVVTEAENTAYGKPQAFRLLFN